jgi:diguanylate cyclase (GGDEF)-like protein
LAVTETEPVEAPPLEIIQRHLQGLRRDPDGGALIELIHRYLRGDGDGGYALDSARLPALYAALTRYAKNPEYAAASRIKARLIQRHLALYLSDPAADITSPEPPPAAAPRTGALPAHEDGTDTRAERPPSAPLPHPELHPGAAPLAPLADADAGEDDPARTEPGAHGGLPALAGNDRLPSPDELEALLFGPQASPEQRYQTLRQSELKAWRTIYGTVKDFAVLKELWATRLQEIQRDRDTLSQRLDEAQRAAQSLAGEREELRLALEQTRNRPPTRSARLNITVRGQARTTRKWSSLPKRDALIRSLEAEVERGRRFRSPLALALIDIQALADINARYGDGADDAVLSCYAGEILGSFRTYDLVTRYDGNEFAVLFPNTDQAGALRALEKAQKRAAETHLNAGGKVFPLPVFSSVLTVYAAGEEPAALLARAHAALDGLRSKGAGKLVVAPPPPTGALVVAASETKH